MQKFNVWEDEEVKTLFKFVEIKKGEGMPLIKIFDEFACKVGRCQKSVRNYYYKEIKILNDNKNRCKRLGINIKEHFAKEPKPFSKTETNNIIERISLLLENGYSVRRACLTLAEGDATKMIRYQNKYRSMLKNQLGNKAGNINKNLNKGGYLSMPTNIIKMPTKRNVMSDEDIKSLFMGIMKLVKKQAVEETKEEYESKLNSANQKLKNAMAEIVIKMANIEKLQSEIELLKTRIEKSKNQQIESRIKSVKNKSAQILLKEFVLKKIENGTQPNSLAK